MTRSEIIKFLILRTIGNFLLLLAIFGVIATFGPTLYYEISFRILQARGVQFKIANAQPQPQIAPGFGAILSGSKQQILVPKDTDFSILIPKIGANARVFPNVDSSNSKEFLNYLSEGVAHAKGTVFPGMKGNIYLFAHSTDNWWNVGRYNAIFYLLKDLTPGDEVVVYFENVRHNYTVVDSRITTPSEVSYITQSHNAPEETLILQTCWPPGTTWRRLLVFAKPKK